MAGFLRTHAYRKGNHMTQAAVNLIPDLANLPDGALLTRKQTAKLTGFTEQTFKKWAPLGRGPKITRVEGRPRYRVADVRRWISGAAA
jgi:hypothetical protein